MLSLMCFQGRFVVVGPHVLLPILLELYQILKILKCCAFDTFECCHQYLVLNLY